MDTDQRIEKKFRKMGANVALRKSKSKRSYMSIDIQGDIFDIEKTDDMQAEVLDTLAKRRHLLLSVEGGEQKAKFLCGHDETHWFVSALPESPVATDVTSAMNALKPAAVTNRESRKKGKNRRKGDVYIRQGEWFFIPCPNVNVDHSRIMQNAQLQRDPESKPHMCETLYRDDEVLFSCGRFPDGVTEDQYQHILKTRRKARRWGWQRSRVSSVIYVKGNISHPDHSTLFLDGWHLVKRNTEQNRNHVGKMSSSSVVRINYRD